MKFVSIIFFVFLSSCAVKKLPIKNPEVKANDLIQFNVIFLKQKNNSMDIAVSAISLKDEVVIKKGDISCGKGNEIGTVAKLIKVKEPYLYLSKSFKEFIVVCQNSKFKTTAGEFYLNFLNIHAVEGGLPGKVVASNVKVVFQ